MTDPTVTHLEGFDRNGMHCGSAEFDGRWWKIRARNIVDGSPCEHWSMVREAAEDMLRQHGAVTITESDGVKR